jgi:hypothetical protein
MHDAKGWQRTWITTFQMYRRSRIMHEYLNTMCTTLFKSITERNLAKFILTLKGIA